MDHGDSTTGSPTPEELLAGLAARTQPPVDARDRIKARVAQHIRRPDLFAELRRALSPDARVRDRVFSAIAAEVSQVPRSLWDRMRASLEPVDHARDLILARLAPRLVPVPVYGRPLKWVAAVAVFLIIVTSSPFVLLAPPTLADLPVTVSGDVYVLGNGLWQQLSEAESTEFRLEESAILQTGDRGGKITMHDDFIVRMAPHTTVAIHDLADRPAALTYDDTMTLHEGTIWVQSFVPVGVAAVSVAVGDARVLLHDGSASIAEGNVQVWNRHVVVEQGSTQTKILAGQQTDLTKPALAVAIPAQEYDRAWVTGNLASDAVHRREVSQLQRERRAARAGILPGNPLYAVKRTAERMSVALTFDAESKTRRLLEQADTRLSEAAALLETDQPEAAQGSLDEYRETVLAASTTSDVSPAIVERELNTDRVDIAAALPGDAVYALKDTVLMTTAEVLPAEKTGVEDEQLADRLQAVNALVAQGAVEQAEHALQEISDTLATQEASAVVREAATSLSVSATALKSQSTAITAVVEATAPELRYPAPRTVLSGEDRMSLVGLILGRLRSVTSPVSICNEVVLAVRQLEIYSESDSTFILGQVIRDAPHELASRVREVLRELTAGKKVICSQMGQPPETTF